MVNDLVFFCNGKRLVGLRYDPGRFELDELRDDFIWCRYGKEYHMRFSFKLRASDWVVIERRVFGLTTKSQTYIIESSVEAGETIVVEF